MASPKNKSDYKHTRFLKLAYEQAKINLGNTKENPSVGCVIEKEGSVISSGVTSINGRPHAEFNALNKKKNFKNANLYVTIEPCSHYGKTPPCTKIILQKNIKKVYFSSFDFDIRSKKKSEKIFKNKKISIKRGILKDYSKDFYKSYKLLHSSNLPLIDAKIAITRDYYTKEKKQKWITNQHSRKIAHLLRSMYDCIVSTSKSINEDNSILDCRLEGLEKKSPDLIIIDRHLKLKKNLTIFKKKIKRKILIFTTSSNKDKISLFKKKGIKIYNFNSMQSKIDYKNLFFQLKKLKYSRVFIESGLTFINYLISQKFINNIYIFKSNKNIKKNGLNFATVNELKKIRLRTRIKINLKSDNLYKERLN